MDPAASPPPTRTDSLVVSSDDDGSGSSFKHQQCRQLLNSSVKVSGLREIDFWVSFLQLFLFTIEQLMRTHAKKSDLRKRLLYPHAKIRFSQIFGCVQAAQPYVKIDFGHVQKKNQFYGSDPFSYCNDIRNQRGKYLERQNVKFSATLSGLSPLSGCMHGIVHVSRVMAETCTSYSLTGRGSIHIIP